MRKFTRKGFTLIEMAVVLVLLGILAALAIPTFSSLITGTTQSAAEASAEAVLSDIRGLAALENRTPLAFIDACTAAATPWSVCTATADQVTIATGEGAVTVTKGVGSTATVDLPGTAPNVTVTFAGTGYPTTFVSA